MKNSVSVIIPVFNDPKGLEDTLEALVRQDCPENFFEIIVVDNGSTDSTFDVAKRWADQHPGRIKALQEKRLRGSYAARNKGIEVAGGQILCFLDADMTMAPDYLRQVGRFFKDNEVGYLGCRVEVGSAYGTLSAKYQKGKAFPIQWYLENRKFVPTCCLSVKRSVIDRVGPFDSRLESGGDWEFGRRVHAAGFSQAFSEEIVLHHPARWRYLDLVKKKKRCARGEAQLNHYYPEEYQGLQGKLLNTKKYMPVRPWRLKQEFYKKGISTNWVELLLFSCFHIPLNLIRFWTFVCEKRKLKKQRVLPV